MSFVQPVDTAWDKPFEVVPARRLPEILAQVWKPPEEDRYLSSESNERLLSPRYAEGKSPCGYLCRGVTLPTLAFLVERGVGQGGFNRPWSHSRELGKPRGSEGGRGKTKERWPRKVE